MYGSYASDQFIEVTYGERYREVEIQFDLTCIARSTAGHYSGPPDRCYPAEPAEFELAKVHIIGSGGIFVEITEDILDALLGNEVVETMLENAYIEADASGEF